MGRYKVMDTINQDLGCIFDLPLMDSLYNDKGNAFFALKRQAILYAMQKHTAEGDSNNNLEVNKTRVGEFQNTLQKDFDECVANIARCYAKYLDEKKKKNNKVTRFEFMSKSLELLNILKNSFKNTKSLYKKDKKKNSIVLLEFVNHKASKNKFSEMVPSSILSKYMEKGFEKDENLTFANIENSKKITQSFYDEENVLSSYKNEESNVFKSILKGENSKVEKLTPNFSPIIGQYVEIGMQNASYAFMTKLCEDKEYYDNFVKKVLPGIKNKEVIKDKKSIEEYLNLDEAKDGMMFYLLYHYASKGDNKSFQQCKNNIEAFNGISPVQFSKEEVSKEMDVYYDLLSYEENVYKKNPAKREKYYDSVKAKIQHLSEESQEVFFEKLEEKRINSTDINIKANQNKLKASRKIRNELLGKYSGKYPIEDFSVLENYAKSKVDKKYMDELEEIKKQMKQLEEVKNSIVNYSSLEEVKDEGFKREIMQNVMGKVMVSTLNEMAKDIKNRLKGINQRLNKILNFDDNKLKKMAVLMGKDNVDEVKAIILKECMKNRQLYDEITWHIGEKTDFIDDIKNNTAVKRGVNLNENDTAKEHKEVLEIINETEREYDNGFSFPDDMELPKPSEKLNSNQITTEKKQQKPAIKKEEPKKDTMTKQRELVIEKEEREKDIVKKTNKIYNINNEKKNEVNDIIEKKRDTKEEEKAKAIESARITKEIYDLGKISKTMREDDFNKQVGSLFEEIRNNTLVVPINKRMLRRLLNEEIEKYYNNIRIQRNSISKEIVRGNNEKTYSNNKLERIHLKGLYKTVKESVENKNNRELLIQRANEDAAKAFKMMDELKNEITEDVKHEISMPEFAKRLNLILIAIDKVPKNSPLSKELLTKKTELIQQYYGKESLSINNKNSNDKSLSKFDSSFKKDNDSKEVANSTKIYKKHY